MATTTAATSGLTKNTDFAAELILNKVMNGQYKASNGNTLTLGGRINAAHLDAQAHTLDVTAENVVKARTIADATVNGLTEMISLAKKAQESNNGSIASTDLAKIGTELQKQFGEIYKATVEGVSVLSGSTTVGLGLGNGALTLGASGDAGIAALSSALSSLAAGSTASNLETTIDALAASLGVHGSRASVIQNRYDMLNDLAVSYKEASDDQAVAGGGSPTSLLNALL